MYLRKETYEPQETVFTLVLTSALGLGVWTLAVTLNPISTNFQAGDTLSSSTFNQLCSDINQNFTNLNNGKVETSGDDMDGRLEIEADTGTAQDPPVGDTAALFVNNTNADGVSAYVRGNSSTTPLYVKNLGSGPLFTATNGTSGLQVENDGSLNVGDPNDPKITLDVASGDIMLDGTVRDSDGNDRLPVAYAFVDSNGNISANTSNVSSATYNTSAGQWEVTIDGEDYDFQEYVTVAASNADQVFATVGSVSGDLVVELFDTSGNAVQADFSFVTYAP
jgi:hypothetical protein